MRVSIRDLRANTKEILDAVKRGESVTIQSRGNSCAMIVPIEEAKESLSDDPAFGMWEDRSDLQDVTKFVRKLREGRKL